MSATPNGPGTVTVSLVVEDVERSVAFYRALGLTIPDDAIYREEGVAHHVGVGVNDGFRLDIDSRSVTGRWNPGWVGATSGARAVLAFEVPDAGAVDALHAALLDAGHAEQVAPFDAFWGARYSVVLDPDENPVGITSPSP